ncbi:MAG: alpha/beta fold hydrolase [Flavobacteriaceae bacterium]
MPRFIFVITLLITLIWSCREQPDKIETTPHNIEWLNDVERVSGGAILVPENHDEPEGRKIKLTYAILESQDTTSSRYPLIFFAGGPGGKTLNPGLIDFLKQDSISEKRDVILFDQRGIGYSSDLPDMSLDAFDLLARDADEAEELVLMQEMINSYQKKCEEEGIQTRYYNTHQNARDVGMLFKHLGYEKYNLMGGSYGTRVARVVQDMFPEYINTSILDSPSPLDGDFLLDRLKSYSLALSRVFDYCEQNPECKNKYPMLEEDYFKAIDKLKQEPLSVMMNDSMEVVINAQDGVYLLRRLLYQGDAREKIPELIRAYIEGEGSVINQVLAMEYGLSTGLNLSMLLSVEKYEQFDLDNSATAIENQYKKYPLIPVKLGFFDAFYQAGMLWHDGYLPPAERDFESSDIPTLIFVNQYDPVTPPENGHLFMKDLSNGTLLILDEGGHGAGNRDCKDRVMNAYMDNPATDLDTSCLNIYNKTN